MNFLRDRQNEQMHSWMSPLDTQTVTLARVFALTQSGRIFSVAAACDGI